MIRRVLGEKIPRIGIFLIIVGFFAESPNVETNAERVKMARMLSRELRQEFKIGMEKSVGKIWTEIIEAVINEKDISSESI